MPEELTPPVKDRIPQETKFNEHVRLAKKGRPELTDSGQEFLTNLYYDHAFNNANPEASTSELLTELQTKGAHRNEINLAKKYFKDKLAVLDDETRVVDMLKEGTSKWSRVLQYAYGETPSPAEVGRFAGIVVDTRQAVRKATQKDDRIPEGQVEENIGFRETATSVILQTKIKQEGTENIQKLVEESVEIAAKQPPLSEKRIGQIRAEVIAKQRKERGAIKNFISDVNEKIPPKVRRNILLGTVTLGVIFGAAGSTPVKETGASTTGAEGTQTVLAGPALDTESSSPAKPVNPEKPGNPQKPESKTENKSVVYSGNEQSQFPGSFNEAAYNKPDGTSGTNSSLLSKFIEDGGKVTNKEALDANRAWMQIGGTLPSDSNELSKRGIGSAFSNGEWGFGYEEGNFLCTNNPQNSKDSGSPRFKVDGNFMRGIGIGEFGDVRALTEAMVEAAMKETGEDLSNLSVQARRDQLVNQLLASKVTFDSQGNVVSDQVLMKGRQDGHQEEFADRVTAISGLENPKDNKDQENKKQIDSKTSLSEVYLIQLDENGKIQQIYTEWYSTAASGVDDLNPEMGANLQATGQESTLQRIRNGFRRLIKPGQEQQQNEKEESVATSSTPAEQQQIDEQTEIPIETPVSDEEEINIFKRIWRKIAHPNQGIGWGAQKDILDPGNSDQNWGGYPAGSNDLGATPETGPNRKGGQANSTITNTENNTNQTVTVKNKGQEKKVENQTKNQDKGKGKTK